MVWASVGDSVIGGTATGFLDAIAIWVNKPHVVNRRLCGSRILHHSSLTTEISADNWHSVVKLAASDFAHVDTVGEVLQKILGANDKEQAGMDKLEVHVWLRDLHPKLLDKFQTQRELVLIDTIHHEAVFVPLLLVDKMKTTSPCQQPAYRITFQTNMVKMFIEESCDNPDHLESSSADHHHTSDNAQTNQLETQPSSHGPSSGARCTADWLRDHLLHKVASWSLHDNLNTDVTSLKLVPLDRYNCRYNDMKARYGPHLVKEWPESTDPQKFVYEDISIAAYLLTLWEVERETLGLTKLQSFVDVGCGNGLLVHLLSEEGHPGKGIDLKKRNIWADFYGLKTHLEEFTITPSDQSLFTGYDWLLGNHSDELTPWIPVIAARSSYTCRYFLLPCCSFDFDAKFAEKAQGRSQYRCYLDFVRDVGQMCGFNVREDTLRIPSTKRICYLGESRTYPICDEEKIDAQRTEFIQSRCSGPPMIAAPGNSHGHRTRVWPDFKPRAYKEKPRNCVSLDKTLITEVADRVFAAVLASDEVSTEVTPDGRTWRTGGSMALGDVVGLFVPKMMKELKNECGGMQTLLRNHYHIFRVQAGRVHIRSMDAKDEQHWQRKRKEKGGQNNEDLRKTRLCYLHQHHPDGCRLMADLCRFAHGKTELKSRLSEIRSDS